MGIFQKVKLNRPRRNKFDLSHERKFSFNMGSVIPIAVQEVVPGDSFRFNTEIMLRLSPLVAPMMHRVNVWTHYFFVPNRLIWDEWEDFITGGPAGTSAPVHPYIEFNQTNYDAGRFSPGSLMDFLGVNYSPEVEVTPIGTPYRISALPPRAYSLIWDEYYRDQNVTLPLDISKASGGVTSEPELAKITQLRKRAWEKDYFTSCLPWAQRGPEVLMPIEGEASVVYRATSEVKTFDGLDPSAGPLETVGTDAGLRVEPGGIEGRIENIDSIDFDGATTTINDLRRSIRIQEWLERNARAGARYVEQILSHFGVRSSDARLQRPEYLGGGRQPVVISEVLQTSETSGSPQGNMAGHGISVGNRNGFKRSFEEHGFVIGVMSVLPRTAYQETLSKMWRRFDKFDYYWPEFANIGEQAVKLHEIYFNPTNVGSGALGTDSTFGYQSRFAEYKYGVSSVHGEFKTNLAQWHMGRIMNGVPALNTDFITSDPTDRVFAVSSEVANTLYCQLYNKVDALRPMPYFGTPTL